MAVIDNYNGLTPVPNYVYSASPPLSGYPCSCSVWMHMPNGAGGMLACLGNSASAGGNSYVAVWIFGGYFIADAESGFSGGFANSPSRVDDGAWHLGVGRFYSSTSRDSVVDGIVGGNDTHSADPWAGVLQMTDFSRPNAFSGGEYVDSAGTICIADRVWYDIALTDAQCVALATGANPASVVDSSHIKAWSPYNNLATIATVNAGPSMTLVDPTNQFATCSTSPPRIHGGIGAMGLPNSGVRHTYVRTYG